MQKMLGQEKKQSLDKVNFFKKHSCDKCDKKIFKRRGIDESSTNHTRKRFTI